MLTDAQKLSQKLYRLRHPEKIKAKERRRWRRNKESERKRNREYHLNNQARVNLRSRLNRHKISEEQLNQMYEQQNNCCAVCGNKFKKTPHIDHDHNCCSPLRSCDKCRRGLLCDDCNLGLGRFKDNTEILRKAIKYLEKYSASIPIARQRRRRSKVSTQPKSNTRDDQEVAGRRNPSLG